MLRKEKTAFNSNNLAIGAEKLAIGDKKLSIEALKSLIKRQNYNESTIKNIIAIYDAIEADQVFGAPQYYVEGSHDAIIGPAKWQLVQMEIQRRKNLGRSHNCCSPFSAKLK